MKETKEILKTYFETGDIPTQEHYANLIDSFVDAKQASGTANRRFVIDENGEVNVKEALQVPSYDISEIVDNKLSFLKDGVSISEIDLAPYLDNTVITSGAVNAEGIATFQNSDGSSFEVDFSALIDAQPTKTSELINDGESGAPFITLNEVPEEENCIHSDGITLKACNLQTKLNDKLIGNWYDNDSGETTYKRGGVFIALPTVGASNIRGKISIGVKSIYEPTNMLYTDLTPAELRFNITLLDRLDWEAYTWNTYSNQELDLVSISNVDSNVDLSSFSFSNRMYGDLLEPDELSDDLNNYYKTGFFYGAGEQRVYVDEEPYEISFGSMFINEEEKEGVYISLPKDVYVTFKNSMFTSLDELEITFNDSSLLNKDDYKGFDFLHYFNEEDVDNVFTSYEIPKSTLGFNTGDSPILIGEVPVVY